MNNIDEFYDDLKSEIDMLNKRYLEKYFPADPSQSADTFEYDVKAFCVLAHACFEEFIEEVSNLILQEIPKNFLNKKIELSTILLLLTYSDNCNIDIDEADEIDSCFDIVRKEIDLCKSKHALSIRDNHGFSLKYLRKMLIPVGVNPKFEPPQEDSIKKLSQIRGSFAHSKSKRAEYGGYKAAKTPLSPDKALEIVMDCLDASKGIIEKVKSKW